MPEIVNPETHHEKSDVNVRALLWAVAIFVSFGAVTHGLLYAQFQFYRGLFRGKTNAPLTSVLRPPDASVPPLPRLQPFKTGSTAPNVSTPVTDMEEMRATEQQALHTPGWVDKQKGIVRVPIDVAKQLTVQRVAAAASAAGARPGAAAPTQGEAPKP